MNRIYFIVLIKALLLGDCLASNSEAFGRLIITKPNGTNHYCDATVVGRKHILTAASCFADADIENGLVEFIADYQGSMNENPKRYVISKAWIPKTFDQSTERGNELSAIRGNFALLEAHSPQSGKWVGEEVSPFAIVDRYDYREELQNLEDNLVQVVSFQNGANEIEIKACRADFADMTDGSVHNTRCNYWNYTTGAPVLEQIGPYYAITALLSGKRNSTGNAVVTRFGRYIGPIRDVIAGRSQNEFEEKEVNWSSTYSVSFKNDCDRSRSAEVHVVYQDYFTGEWKMETNRSINRNDVEAFSLRTRGDVIYFRATSGSQSWGKGDRHYLVDGSSQGFTRVELNKNADGSKRFGDEKLSLTCD